MPTDQIAERFLVPNRAWRRIAASKTASAGTRQQLRNQWRRRPIGSTAPRRPAIANRGTPESNRGAGLQVRRRDGSNPGRRYPQPPRSARKPIEESFGRLPSPLDTSTGCSKPATSTAAPLNPKMPGTDRAAAGRHQDGKRHRPGPERRPMQIDGFKRTRGGNPDLQRDSAGPSSPGQPDRNTQTRVRQDRARPQTPCRSPSTGGDCRRAPGRCHAPAGHPADALCGGAGQQTGRPVRRRLRRRRARHHASGLRRPGPGSATSGCTARAAPWPTANSTRHSATACCRRSRRPQITCATRPSTRRMGGCGCFRAADRSCFQSPSAPFKARRTGSTP